MHPTRTRQPTFVESLRQGLLVHLEHEQLFVISTNFSP